MAVLNCDPAYVRSRLNAPARDILRSILAEPRCIPGALETIPVFQSGFDNRFDERALTIWGLVTDLYSDQYEWPSFVQGVARLRVQGVVELVRVRKASGLCDRHGDTYQLIPLRMSEDQLCCHQCLGYELLHDESIRMRIPWQYADSTDDYATLRFLTRDEGGDAC